jgi:hypothetical protein
MESEITVIETPVSLTPDIAALLKIQLGDNGAVTTCGQHILICLKKADVEERLGTILQQVYRVIDQNFPVRTEHLSLIIRDTDMQYKNTFKIWKSA